MQLEITEVIKALAKYRQAATKAEQDAGYSGAMHDGGASHMRELADAYENGWNHIVPEFLAKYIKQARHEADPEYSKYQELKKKFEK